MMIEVMALMCIFNGEPVAPVVCKVIQLFANIEPVDKPAHVQPAPRCEKVPSCRRKHQPRRGVIR